MLHSISSVATHLLKYHSKQSFRMFAITFTLMIYLNSAVSDLDDSSAKNEVYKNDSGMNWDSIDGAQNDNEPRSSQILSRKRRYLTFPSGSSFQVVYELVVGVVDFTNYLVVSITSALAWQLPSEPPSEILENLRNQLSDGTFGTSRNDKIGSITYVDTKQEYQQKPVYISSGTSPSYSQPQTSSYYTSNRFHPTMKTQKYSSSPVYYSQQTRSNAFTRKQDTDYFSVQQNPLTQWKDSNMRKVSQSYAAPKSSSSQSVVSEFSQYWTRKPKEAYNREKAGFARKHRIFPVYGKRSVDAHNRQKRHGIEGPSLTKIDSIHLRYHRSTRQVLYHKIARYLETQNKNGHECVLKALCETGQKGNEVEPGTFVGEIMRSIFTIPESEDPSHNYKHKLYDDAHTYDGSCVERYPLCPDSVWKADFVL